MKDTIIPAHPQLAPPGLSEKQENEVKRIVGWKSEDVNICKTIVFIISKEENIMRKAYIKKKENVSKFGVVMTVPGDKLKENTGELVVKG